MVLIETLNCWHSYELSSPKRDKSQTFSRFSLVNFLQLMETKHHREKTQEKSLNNKRKKFVDKKVVESI